ncbi:MAG: hypothetical protein ACQZ2J_01980 [Pseudomonas piscis]|uniref:hypothetical protein n=1 Tax=Pseudomonas piscis TaxID=2614538 RepID=UPI003D2686FA
MRSPTEKECPGCKTRQKFHAGNVCYTCSTKLRDYPSMKATLDLVAGEDSQRVHIRASWGKGMSRWLRHLGEIIIMGLILVWILEPVFWQGHEPGYVQGYADTVLIAFTRSALTLVFLFWLTTVAERWLQHLKTKRIPERKKN